MSARLVARAAPSDPKAIANPVLGKYSQLFQLVLPVTVWDQNPTMSMDGRPRQILDSALKRLLRPLVRILIRRSISCAAFEALIRDVYVDVAMNDFSIDGKKPTLSRASVLTGLSRKEVQRLWTLAPQEREDYGDRYNRAARVMTAWIREGEFLDPAGQPRALPLDGSISFVTLSKRFSGDMPPKAVLDELLRVGAVSQRADGLLEPVARAYVPQQGVVDKLRILGSDVADMIETIEHNVERGATDPYFQRKVMYDSIPIGALAAFRLMSAAASQRLLEELDRHLSEVDQRARPDDTEADHARVGVGIYYFEEMSNPAQPPESKEP